MRVVLQLKFCVEYENGKHHYEDIVKLHGVGTVSKEFVCDSALSACIMLITEVESHRYIQMLQS